MKGVDEDELDGSHGTLSTQNKQPQPERHKSINVIECQYEREPFNDEDVLCKPDGDYEEDLYDDKDLANNDTEDSVIFDKSLEIFWKIILVFL
jgi:hypothetical protein